MKYDSKYEKFLIGCFLYNHSLYARAKTILSEKYFKNKESLVMKHLINYEFTNETLPTVLEIEALFDENYKGIILNDVQENAVLLDIEKFCRQKACENVIYNSPDLINSGREEEIVPLMQNAVMTSLPSTFGSDPFENVDTELIELHKQQGEVKTLWKEVDEILQGGLGYGEIEVFSGASGGGKSLALQNLSVNLIQQGLNVMYFTLELSERNIMKRIVSMVSGWRIGDMKRNEDQVRLALEDALTSETYSERGTLRVIYTKPSTTTMQIESIVKEYELKTGTTINAIVIDYADLVDPVKKVAADNLHLKGKYVYEELRSIATERTNRGKKTVIITASQITKEAVNEVGKPSEMNYGKMSGGVTKAYTADNVFALAIKPPQDEDITNCEVKFAFLKTRNSAGTGRYIKLGYDMNTLRMKDYIVKPPKTDEIKELNEIIGNNKTLEKITKKEDNIETISF